MGALAQRAAEAEEARELQVRSAAEIGRFELENKDGSVDYFDANAIRIITNVPNATDQEIIYFMALCRAHSLDPRLKEAYLIKYNSSPAQIVVSHQVLLRRAENNPQFDGMEYGVTVLRDGQIHQEARTAAYDAAGETLVGGWCRIYRKDRRVPYYNEVAFREFNKNQSVWKTMPALMIVKCAQAACIRTAFPDDNGGLYSDAEAGIPVASVSEPVETRGAGRVAQAANPDMDELRHITSVCVAAGAEEPFAKRVVWDAYREGGLDKAREVADGLVAGAEMAVNVNPETGEVM